jgi:hypothetical protein
MWVPDGSIRKDDARNPRHPPNRQAFAVSLDLQRSRRFPVCAPTFGLRPLMRVTDPETLAANISQKLQVRGSGLESKPLVSTEA